MKRALFLSLILGNAFAEVPSNIKRTEIELERDGIDMHRAPISLQLAGGSSSSTFNSGNYGFKDGKLSAGTKFILGTVDRDGAAGFAIAPDLKVQFRLDSSGKKLRLEAGGKLISAYDIQYIFVKGTMSNQELESATSELAQSQIYLEQYEKMERETSKELADLIKRRDLESDSVLQREIVKTEATLAENKKAVASYKDAIKKQQDILAADQEKIKQTKAYATLDFSFANLGGEYKEVADAFYKFAGAKGSALTVSFDLAAKNKGGSVRVGICGVADLLTATAGRNETKEGVFNVPTLGVGGSVCARFGVGPVMLTNTFGAQVQGNDYFQTASINNNARLGVKTGIIPGIITEVGAFHNYSHEWYPGGEIDSHMVGGGITVLAK